MAGGRRKGVAADCRADTRGGPWAGIPLCVINSAAHRDLSLHARAVLVELVARMNGYNNGSIAVSQRELVDAIGCSPNRIVTAIADLTDHGLLDVTVAGEWKARLARQYRLTFVSTKGARATNDYVAWTPAPKKSGATGAVAEGVRSATGAIAVTTSAATGAVARLIAHRRGKATQPPTIAATGAVSLIQEPYHPAPERERKGDEGSSSKPPTASGYRCDNVTDEHRCCEQCGGTFGLDRPDRAHVRRFCSETCRKRAERARAAERRRHGSAAEVADVLQRAAGGKA